VIGNNCSDEMAIDALGAAMSYLYRAPQLALRAATNDPEELRRRPRTSNRRTS